MFESPDTLGRKIAWAFKAPQLLVVPMAGQWENAFYERTSHSLQFFYFDHPDEPGKKVYTCLSRDIVSHETGHAILDGIAPHMFHAVSPQTLALHEGIADLVAALMSFRSRELVDRVLKRTGGSIADSSEFNSLAEQFGKLLDPNRNAASLRNLRNNKTLDPNDQTIDENGHPNRVSRSEPHELSQVVSGALYAMMLKIHAKRWTAEKATGVKDPVAASGLALGLGANQFKRMVLRALDYLPPGEVSFADYGRAILAADEASHPDDPDERGWLCDEFVRRKMVASDADLKVETNYEAPGLAGVDLQTLVDSEWAAYEFAKRNRKMLGIPPNMAFTVDQRLDVTKTYIHKDGRKNVRECIFKVWWSQEEANAIGRSFPRKRSIVVGTTLAIDWETRLVRCLLTSDHKATPEGDQQKETRSLMLQQLADEGLLELSELGYAPGGKEFRSKVRGRVSEGALSVRGTARMLHIIRRR